MYQSHHYTWLKLSETKIQGLDCSCKTLARSGQGTSEYFLISSNSQQSSFDDITVAEQHISLHKEYNDQLSKETEYHFTCSFLHHEEPIRLHSYLNQDDSITHIYEKRNDREYHLTTLSHQELEDYSEQHIRRISATIENAMQTHYNRTYEQFQEKCKELYSKTETNDWVTLAHQIAQDFDKQTKCFPSDFHLCQETRFLQNTCHLNNVVPHETAPSQEEAPRIVKHSILNKQSHGAKANHNSSKASLSEEDLRPLVLLIERILALDATKDYFDITQMTLLYNLQEELSLCPIASCIPPDRYQAYEKAHNHLSTLKLNMFTRIVKQKSPILFQYYNHLEWKNINESLIISNSREELVLSGLLKGLVEGKQYQLISELVEKIGNLTTIRILIFHDTTRYDMGHTFFAEYLAEHISEQLDAGEEEDSLRKLLKTWKTWVTTSYKNNPEFMSQLLSKAISNDSSLFTILPILPETRQLLSATSQSLRLVHNIEQNQVDNLQKEANSLLNLIRSYKKEQKEVPEATRRDYLAKLKAIQPIIERKKEHEKTLEILETLQEYHTALSQTGKAYQLLTKDRIIDPMVFVSRFYNIPEQAPLKYLKQLHEAPAVAAIFKQSSPEEIEELQSSSWADKLDQIRFSSAVINGVLNDDSGRMARAVVEEDENAGFEILCDLVTSRRP